MLKITLDAAGYPGCLSKPPMTLYVAGCTLKCWMSIYAPGWTWLHLDVAGCTLMCLVAARCLYFRLGGNLGHQCTLMVFDANLAWKKLPLSDCMKPLKFWLETEILGIFYIEVTPQSQRFKFVQKFQVSPSYFRLVPTAICLFLI